MSQPLINISSKQAYTFAFFLVLYEFLTYISNDMIMPGMIDVVKAFHASESGIGKSFAVYVLGGATLQLLLGPLSDCYGRRPVMLFGAFFFFVCTWFIAISHSMDQFLAARFFQGMGLCFICVVGYATLQEIYAEMEAIRLISIMANVSVTAPLIGPLLGVIFIQYFSWRMIFVVIGILALLAWWGLWRYMPESIGQTQSDGHEIKAVKLSYRVILANYKALLWTRAFMRHSIALGLLSLPCSIWIALSPVMLVLDAKLTMVQYGVWQLPVFGAYILGNIVLQRMTHHRNLKQLLSMGSWMAVTGALLAFILPFTIKNHFYYVMPGLMIYFFGYGFLGAPLNRFALFSTPVAKGTASAALSMLTMLILALGVEAATIINIAHNMQWFGFACAIIGMVCCFFIKKS